jgi:hypothetical protein
MRHIKPYQIFESSAPASTLTKRQINWLDKCVDGRWKLNPQTGLVDVGGDFDCSDQGLTDLKGVEFGDVRGYFFCNDNQLITLEGAPQSVVGFFCNDNQLITLEGAPQTVKGGFWCYDNELTTLEGAPQTVGGNFSCNGNHLTSLEGAPQTVGGYFHCNDNQLTSLEGAPQTVKGDFDGSHNTVSETTLKAIFALMKKGKPYQQALEECWPEMGDEDRVLMYKEMPNLPQEDARKYKALATYSKIKGYL